MQTSSRPLHAGIADAVQGQQGRLLATQQCYKTIDTVFVVPRDVRYLGPFLIQVDEHVVAKASHLILRPAAFGQDLDMTDPLEPPRE